MVLCLFHVNSLSDPKDLLIPFIVTNPARLTENWPILGRRCAETLNYSCSMGFRFTAGVNRRVTSE
jgi:hypothetical protein